MINVCKCMSSIISPLNFKPNVHIKSTLCVSKKPQCHASLDFLVAHSTQYILLPCWKIIPLPITYSILLQLSWQEILLTSESLKMTLAYTWHSVSVGKSMNSNHTSLQTCLLLPLFPIRVNITNLHQVTQIRKSALILSYGF